MSAFYFSRRVSFGKNYLVLKTNFIEEMKSSSAIGNSVVSPVQDKFFCGFECFDGLKRLYHTATSLKRVRMMVKHTFCLM